MRSCFFIHHRLNGLNTHVFTTLRRIFYLALFLLFLPSISFADLTITVKPDARWGEARTSNIQRLCENVALHFQENLRDEHKVSGKLTIIHREGNPRAFYRSSFGGAPNEYKIGLSVTNRFWDNFSFQFGHEFCHIMQNHDAIHEVLPDNKNGWFQESICELASLWVLRRMGETWAYRAPYNNWVDYRYALIDYANNWLMGREEVQYEGTAAEWLKEWEEPMRQNQPNAFSYARVAQLSYKFLPIFEENPETWNAVRQMPFSNLPMSEYMREWYNAVDTEDKPFVEAIAKEMGIAVKSEPVASIDADVNNDGYVDLYDVMIVRSGMQNSVSYDTDINNDGVTNEIDLLIVKAKAFEAIAAASPRKRRSNITTWGKVKSPK